MARDLVGKASRFSFGAALVPFPVVSLMISGVNAVRDATRWRPRSRTARIALVAAVLGCASFAGSAIAVEGLSPSAANAISIAVIVAVAAAIVPAGRSRSNDGSWETAGLLASALALAAVSVTSYVISGERVSAWGLPPNTWGASAASGIAAAFGLRFVRSRPSASALLLLGGGIAVAVTGSRTAALALAGAALTYLLQHQRSRIALRRHAPLVIAAVVGTLLIVFVSPLGTRLAVFQELPERNRLLASEELTSSLWTRRDVIVEGAGEAQGVARHELIATATDGLSRLHQRHVLAPGHVVTFAVELAGAHVAEAGLHVFSEEGGRVSVDATGTVRIERTPPSVVSFDVTAVNEGWRRLALTLRNDEDTTITLRSGIAPSLTGRERARVLVRKPSLTTDGAVGPYEGTTEADRQRELALLSARQRSGYVVAAFDVFRAAPWLGHGPSSDFASLADRFAPGRLIGSNRPSHPHSLPMSLLVEHGLVGTLGFLVAALALGVLIGRAAQGAMLPYLVAVVIANLGDATLLTGFPLYAGLAVALRVARENGFERAN